MKPSSYRPISTTAQTSPDTATVRTFTVPNNSSAFLLTVETNDARFTFDGTDPTVGTGSHVYPKALPPQLVLLGSGTTVKAVSTAAGNAVVNITWLS